MTQRILSCLICIFLILPSHSAHATSTKQKSLSYEDFKEIPILHEGRVKPLESFARSYLLVFHGKNRLRDLNASEWLAELLFDQETAYQRDVFNISNPDVVHAIGLSWKNKHRYSYKETSQALQIHNDTVATIYRMKEEERTRPQQELLNLYFKVFTYAEISHSLSLIQPRFVISTDEVATILNSHVASTLSYIDVMGYEDLITEKVKFLSQEKEKKRSPAEQELLDIAFSMVVLSEHKNTSIFRIIPPQWEQDEDVWYSPWANIIEGKGSPQSAKYLELWRDLAKAYQKREVNLWQKNAKLLHDHAFTIAGDQASSTEQNLEVFYHKANFFHWALILYGLSTLLLTARFVKNYTNESKTCSSDTGQDTIYRLCIGSVFLGMCLQICGIILRMLIMDRPPVSTLYETTIFVSLISVFLCLMFEKRRKDSTGLFVASLIGMILLVVSKRYAADGDTMEMLVAVLDTNFWLATHVVTITIGYGCALVAGTLGHIYLLQKYFIPHNTEQLSNTLNTIMAVSLIALFFSLLGTILGGIWADQSWGRFWGWDPKENGALWIVLWLLWCFHGRISSILSATNFASCIVLTNIIVALAWFGVNLLSVGLHSYGFTSNIASNLAIFCGLEILFLACIRISLLKKEKIRAQP